MKFRHLEFFVAAAEELNLTHAADRLHVSQPPFSKQIHDLEGELGIEFFERQRKGVALTPEGRISVGILVPSDRPVLELLKVRLLIKYPVSLALPKSHPHANKPEIPLSLLKE